MQIDPALLEEGQDTATCPMCKMVLNQPTAGCPEGHVICRQCYVSELSRKKQCPFCHHPTDAGKLRRFLPFEHIIGQLRVRCKHGLLESKGVGAGGVLRRVKCAKQAPKTATSSQDEAQRCSWRGRVCELAGHLAESCDYELVECPNVEFGCKKSVLRKDVARHSSETCAYRQEHCTHCDKRFEILAQPEHEASCPEARIECPNAACGVMVARRSMAEHRLVCEREEVECPWPGCEVRVARAAIGKHEQVAGAVHAWKVWNVGTERAVQMEEKVAGQKAAIIWQQGLLQKQSALIADLHERVVLQNSVSDPRMKLLAEQHNAISQLRQKVVEQDSVIAEEKEKVQELRALFVKQNEVIGVLFREAERQSGAMTVLREEPKRQCTVNTWLQKELGSQEKVVGNLKDEIARLSEKAWGEAETQSGATLARRGQEAEQGAAVTMLKNACEGSSVRFGLGGAGGG